MSQPNEILKEPFSSDISAMPWLISHESRAFFDAWQKGDLAAQYASFCCYDDDLELIPSSDTMGPIAVIGTGDTLYRSYYSSYGVSGICRLLSSLDSNDTVKVIIFRTTVWGGDEGSSARINDAIAQCSKPVYFYIDYGGALSGGYLMASACKGGIYASRSTDRVGSIGSYLTYIVPDPEGNHGYKQVEVYSSLSPKKNQDHREVQKGNLGPAIETADKITEAFYAAVLANRPQIKRPKGNDPFEGMTYMASEALELGLIDGICSWEEMLAKVASTEITVTNFSTNTNMLGFFKVPKLASLSGLDAATITEDQLRTANEELGTLGLQGLQLVKEADLEQLLGLQTAGAQLATVQGQLNAANAKVTTHEATIAQLNAEIAQLKATTPGATPAPLHKTTTDVIPDSGQQSGKIVSETDEYLAKMKAGIPVIQ